MEISNEQVILAYADDVVIMGETKEEVINATSNLINPIKTIHVNEGKKKYMVVSGDVRLLPIDLFGLRLPTIIRLCMILLQNYKYTKISQNISTTLPTLIMYTGRKMKNIFLTP